MTQATLETKPKNNRQMAHLQRLAEGGGKPVRVDTQGSDLKKVDDLVAAGYAPSRAEAYRRAVRAAYHKMRATQDATDKG